MWRTAQRLLVLGAAALVLSLVLRPRAGLFVLWDVIIPVAPALLVFAPGLFRNLCPLATLASGGVRTVLPPRRRDALRAVGVALLWLMVPARRVLLDHHGPATAAVLLLVAGLAVLVGARLGRRAWCASLCPVHPVERLYGFASAWSAPNARCRACVGCMRDCPDLSAPRGPPRARWFERAMLGGFPGFIWGWFQVAPRLAESWRAVALAWALPLAGAVVTALLFALAQRAGVERLFAAAAITTYYWFRLPELFGPSVTLSVLALVPGAWLLARRSGRAWARVERRSKLSINEGG